MKIFKTLALVALVTIGLSHISHAQTGTTVASCPGATVGTVWAAGIFLPCASGVVYIATPVPSTAIISDMNCPVGGSCIITWTNQAGTLPTDQAWIKTTAAPTGVWAAISTLTFSGTTPPAYTTSAVLTWAAPTLNTDGSPLIDLAGFNIYMGYSTTVSIQNKKHKEGVPTLTKSATVSATTLNYTVTIPVGVTYFAVTAFNSETPVGESVYSTIVSKTVVQPAPPASKVPNSPTIVVVK